MSTTILTMEVRREHDVVFTRQRARQIADLLGFDPQNQRASPPPYPRSPATHSSMRAGKGRILAEGAPAANPARPYP